MFDQRLADTEMEDYKMEMGFMAADDYQDWVKMMEADYGDTHQAAEGREAEFAEMK